MEVTATCMKASKTSLVTNWCKLASFTVCTAFLDAREGRRAFSSFPLFATLFCGYDRTSRFNRKLCRREELRGRTLLQRRSRRHLNLTWRTVILLMKTCRRLVTSVLLHLTDKPTPLKSLLREPEVLARFL